MTSCGSVTSLIAVVEWTRFGGFRDSMLSGVRGSDDFFTEIT